ncbi:GerMN domain-containing protein [Pantanalinema rosaneae CENA516]|uniref:GerMN domain-containing protein n=1 Tax=Pantanalinema rosaneae TaxID=1620701 RepID=UPI003D6FA66C
MQDHHTHESQSHRPIPLSLLAGLSAVVLITGSAAAWWGWTTVARKVIEPVGVEHSTPQTSPVGQGEQKIPATGTAQPPAVAPATTEKTLQVYWLKATDTTIALAPTAMTLSASNDSGLLQEAIKQLLAGQPTDQSLATTIPATTKLLGLTVKDDGVHVDLSNDFTKGGGSTSMTARVGQIVYTASTLNPNVPVWLSVEGVPLDTLGGEGLLIDQPMTRQSFEQNFSL